VSEGIVEKATEKAVERVSERAVERAAEQTSMAALGHTAAGATTLQRTSLRSTERIVERGGEAVIERTCQRPLRVSVERITIRIGRGLTTLLPILGGVFSFYLFRSDYKRWRDEHDTTLLDRKKFLRVSLFLFCVAGVADLLDAFLHFWLAYGLLMKLRHHVMIFTEQLSMCCAVVSNVSAVLGEIASHQQQ